ncbi:ROK family transcriptional regulator [Arachnia propionica]|uniref:ROK family transcriptional regulator n=1 Tax=Arachnia propionica TaxID=1750 RepID=A0A3P1WTE0_9ACTN|nr:ROK family transcriptional regulator [Arachnia propionica]RRD48630.1 ROK family transcriptional regulator [Arachnia propionica]
METPRTAPAAVIRVGARLRDGGPSGASALAVELGLSRTAVENALATLEDLGLVTHAPGTPGGAGRPARRFAFAADAGVVLGLDVGVHSVRCRVVDLAGFVISQRTDPGLEAQAGPADQVDSVIATAEACLAEAASGRVRAVGVALPGIVDDTSRVVASVVLPGWTGIDVVGILGSRLGCPAALDNGVRLAALAEHHIGAGRLFEDVLHVAVGSRVAVGMVLGGEARRGVHHLAGDIGRVAFSDLVDPAGQLRWRSAAGAREVFELAERGDVSAVAEIEAVVAQLGRGIATVAMAVDPGVVVVGGGLTQAGEAFLQPLRDELARLFGDHARIPVLAGELGVEAAVRGAVIHAFTRCSQAIHGLDGMPPPLGSATPGVTPSA